MSAEEQIGKIFSIVSDIRVDVADLKANANHVAEKINEHANKLRAIDDIIAFFKDKRTETETELKIAGKATWFFFGLGGSIAGVVIGGFILHLILK